MRENKGGWVLELLSKYHLIIADEVPTSFTPTFITRVVGMSIGCNIDAALIVGVTFSLLTQTVPEQQQGQQWWCSRKRVSYQLHTDVHDLRCGIEYTLQH